MIPEPTPSILVDLDVAGVHIHEPESPACKAWLDLIADLRRPPPEKQGDAVSEAYGYDEDTAGRVLLLVAQRSESELLSTISSLTAVLPSPPIVHTISNDFWRFMLNASIQQTIFYFPVQDNDSENRHSWPPVFLEKMIGAWCDTATHRCLVRYLFQAEVLGEVQYRGQKCKAWMVFTRWCDDDDTSPSRIVEGEQRRDDASSSNVGNGVRAEQDPDTANRVKKNNSLAAQFNLQTFGVLGYEERNWYLKELKEAEAEGGWLSWGCIARWTALTCIVS